MMFYNEDQAIKVCISNPVMIFELIKEGYTEVVDKLLTTNKELINTIDENGNSVMMRLLNKKDYSIVLKHSKNKYWDVNHQNKDKNTFAHFLVMHNYVDIAKILEILLKNKTFIPNLKNNKGETILDKAIVADQLFTITKILGDKRFDNIDIISFKYLYTKYIKNSYYGKYSKLNNLEVIINSLEHKQKLQPKMQELLEKITTNMDTIKKDLLTNKLNNIDIIINSLT